MLLGSAVFFELIATSSLKASDGFTRALPTGMTVIGCLWMQSGAQGVGSTQ